MCHMYTICTQGFHRTWKKIIFRYFLRAQRLPFIAFIFCVLVKLYPTPSNNGWKVSPHPLYILQLTAISRSTSASRPSSVFIPISVSVSIITVLFGRWGTESLPFATKSKSASSLFSLKYMNYICWFIHKMCVLEVQACRKLLLFVDDMLPKYKSIKYG